MNRQTKLAALLAATFVATPAVAVCLLDDYSVTAEFARSPLVVLGSVISKVQISDAKATDGIGGTTYLVKIDLIFRGSADSSISLLSENSSGRFPMLVGAEYILFVGSNRGIWSVDNCGNSTDVTHGQPVISTVEKLSGNAGT